MNINVYFGYLLIIFAVLLWSINTIIVRVFAALIPPFTFAFWRWFFAFSILLFISFGKIKEDLLLLIKLWKTIFLLSILGITLFTVLIYCTLQYISVTTVSVFSSIMPIVVVLSCFFMYGEKINMLQFLAILISCVGVCYIFTKEIDLNTYINNNINYLLNNVLIIIAVICYGLYLSILPKISLLHPLSFLTIVSGFGMLELFPLYLIELSMGNTFELTFEIVIVIFYVSTFASVIAYFCWIKGAKLIGTTRSGLFMNLIPVFTIIMAVLFLDESFYGYHAIGVSLVFLGIIVFNFCY